MSLDNLEALQAVRLASGEALEFIIAVPGRRYCEFVDLLQPFHATHCQSACREVIDERVWNSLRLVMAHDPETAAAQTQQRNAHSASLAPAAVVARYKSLADIERGFKVLKSELEIGPCYHRLPERIRAHASICFMALILHRVMRSRLQAANTGLSPDRAIDPLQRIQHHRVCFPGGKPMAGVSTLTSEQNQVLHALRIKNQHYLSS